MLYTREQLQKRENIIKSQLQFCNFLDSPMVNVLIHLFDNEYNNYINKNEKITKYIEDERNIRGLNTSNIKIKSEVYGYNNDNSTLYLTIKKNNKDLLHLTIHLCVRNINPEHSGVIHMYKNIYKIKKRKGNNINKMLYLIISVNQPKNKPNSLEFSIINDSSTLYNNNYQLHQEIDVIITVLNRLFDEDNKKYYIGNTDKLFPIHNKTNSILENINRHDTYCTRKNKGIKMYPKLTNSSNITIKYNNGKNKRKTRKIYKY